MHKKIIIINAKITNKGKPKFRLNIVFTTRSARENILFSIILGALIISCSKRDIDIFDNIAVSYTHLTLPTKRIV